MLFPNHPRYAELTPRMGYSSGSFHLGYAGGARNFSYMGFSDSVMQAALAQGLDANTLNALNSVGATDADIQALMRGDTDVPTLMEKYGGLKSTEGTFPVSSGAPGITSLPGTTTGPMPSQAGQVPSGSTLLYTATVVGGPGDLTVSPDSAAAQFSAALTAHGMTVVSSSNDETVLNKLFGTGAAIHFQFQILDTIGHNLQSDAKSVCDGVLQQIVGSNVTTSNLSITGSPGQSIVAAPAAGNDVLSWIEDNALFIGAAVAGLVVLNNVTGGRRR